MDPDIQKPFQDLGISLLLGLLVGLQRQRTDTGWAGMRTFALFTILGTVCAFLANEFNNAWIVVAGFFAVLGV